MLIGITAACQLVSLNWYVVVFSCGCKKFPVKNRLKLGKEHLNHVESSITCLGFSIGFLLIPCEEYTGNLVMRLKK